MKKSLKILVPFNLIISKLILFIIALERLLMRRNNLLKIEGLTTLYKECLA